MKKKETVAQEALRLLSPIPEDQWAIDKFVDSKKKCCAMGHYTRLKSKNPKDYSYDNCADDGTIKKPLREASAKFIKSKKPSVYYYDIAEVNNHNRILKYNQDTPKKRVVALLNDMIESGY